MLVFNKIDQYTFEKKDEDDLLNHFKEFQFEDLQKSWISK